MYRSRLKRCQPLLPSNETNPLKKSFVAPRALSTDSSNSEEKKGNDKMEKKTIPVTTQSTLEKKKVFVSPYHRPSQSNEIKDNATNNATNNATSNANGYDNLASYCFSYVIFDIITIIPTKMSIIIMTGNSLLHIFDIVFIPLVIIIPAIMVMISDIITLFILYMFVVRVVMVLF